jgi:hypothetical protein
MGQVSEIEIKTGSDKSATGGMVPGARMRLKWWNMQVGGLQYAPYFQDSFAFGKCDSEGRDIKAGELLFLEDTE